MNRAVSVNFSQVPLFNNSTASPLVGEAEFQHEERVLEIQVRGNLRTSCVFRPLTRICSSLRSHNCGLSHKGRGYEFVVRFITQGWKGILASSLPRQCDYYVGLESVSDYSGCRRSNVRPAPNGLGSLRSHGALPKILLVMTILCCRASGNS